MLLTRLNLNICLSNLLFKPKAKAQKKQEKCLIRLKSKNTFDVQAKVTFLHYDEIVTCFKEAEELIDIDANSSIQKFNKGLLTAGECMKKTIVIGKERRQIWFDLRVYTK